MSIKALLRRIPPIRKLHDRWRLGRPDRILKRQIALARRQEAGAALPEDGLPVPDPGLRYRVHGTVEREGFLHVGKVCAQDIKRLVAAEGREFGSFQTVLDFGCGCGRVLRYLSDGKPGAKFFGTDVDEESTAWCRAHLPLAEWSTNGYAPPLRYADGSFDFIFAISVFTHLDEADQFAWLKELRRISAKGGFLLLTTHGLVTESWLTPAQKEALAQKGFIFSPGKMAEPGVDAYCLHSFSIHSDEYVRREWGKYFKVLRIADRGINGYQSAVLLQNTL